MDVLPSVPLFALAAGLAWIGAAVLALRIYGFVATFQPDPHFGRILAAYGGVFVAGSLAWGMALDGFKPDRWELLVPLCAWWESPSSWTPRGTPAAPRPCA
jgi:small multidrug resistance family-3 protein